MRELVSLAFSLALAVHFGTVGAPSLGPHARGGCRSLPLAEASSELATGGPAYAAQAEPGAEAGLHFGGSQARRTHAGCDALWSTTPRSAKPDLPTCPGFLCLRGFTGHPSTAPPIGA